MKKFQVSKDSKIECKRFADNFGGNKRNINFCSSNCFQDCIHSRGLEVYDKTGTRVITCLGYMDAEPFDTEGVTEIPILPYVEEFKPMAESGTLLKTIETNFNKMKASIKKESHKKLHNKKVSMFVNTMITFLQAYTDDISNLWSNDMTPDSRIPIEGKFAVQKDEKGFYWSFYNKQNIKTFSGDRRHKTEIDCLNDLAGIKFSSFRESNIENTTEETYQLNKKRLEDFSNAEEFFRSVQDTFPRRSDLELRNIGEEYNKICQERWIMNELLFIDHKDFMENKIREYFLYKNLKSNAKNLGIGKYNKPIEIYLDECNWCGNKIKEPKQSLCRTCLEDNAKLSDEELDEIHPIKPDIEIYDVKNLYIIGSKTFIKKMKEEYKNETHQMLLLEFSVNKLLLDYPELVPVWEAKKKEFENK